MSTHLVALTPGQLTAQQTRLVEWMDGRIQRAEAELADATAVLSAAEQAGFNLEPHRRMVRKARTRAAYYRKLRGALAAGYIIVPNFPLDLLAVRTDEAAPRRKTGHQWSTFDQPGKALKPGEGRYVSPLPYRSSYVEKNKEGKEVRHYFPSSFDQTIDFPLDVARPEVMDATRQAMALELFDQVGVARNNAAAGDPIVCGVIRDPTRRGRQVTFFVAWCLNPEDL